MATIESERTPNPNSLKFTTSNGQFLENGIKAFASEEEAENHDLGRQLFAIRDVEDVFITPSFVTVSKAASADWSDLKAEVESTLEEYLDR